MDNERLLEAARTGNIVVLHELLAKNPLILADVALLSHSAETPLHVAVKAGQLDFVREIIKHKPELAGEMGKDGYRPLDTAVITGQHIDIVRQLLGTNNAVQICRLQGKDERTALHYAAANGRVEIINELISACPDSIQDATVHGETALHLAVKNHQFTAFSVLVKWLENLNDRSVINYRDRDGNSVLHLATARRQYNSVELLVGKNKFFSGVVEVNATNAKGLTAMHILEIVMEEANDIYIRKILQNAMEIHEIKEANNSNSNSALSKVVEKKKQSSFPEEPLKDWFKYFKFQLRRDSPSDTRNVLLVVAALIASVTFQAGLDPSASLLKDSKSNSTGSNASPMPAPPTPAHHPVVSSGLLAVFALLGSPLATLPVFLFGNSFALTASLSIIVYLTVGFPFQRELLMAIFSMTFAYGCSVYRLINEESEDGDARAAGHVLVTLAFILPFAIRWIPIWVIKGWKWLKGSPTS